MAAISVADYVKEHHPEVERRAIGPFLTLSRQYGCWGYSLATLVRDLLSSEAGGPGGPGCPGCPGRRPWTVYGKELLGRLASETHVDAELLERERRMRPRFVVDLLRSLSDERIPSGYEIRHRITRLIRAAAIDGFAIIVGQGGAAATADIPRGLSVRLEAPLRWRVRRVMVRDKLTEAAARLLIQSKEREREYVRGVYALWQPHRPAFHVVYDCAAFTMPQIAAQVLAAMRAKGLL